MITTERQQADHEAHIEQLRARLRAHIEERKANPQPPPAPRPRRARPSPTIRRVLRAVNATLREEMR